MSDLVQIKTALISVSDKTDLVPFARKLVGYGVYRGVIGHIDRRSPIGLIDPDADTRLSWDK